MSGGVTEYVMGILSDTNGKPRSGYSYSRNSGFNGKLYDGEYNEGILFPQSKYYNVFTSENRLTACNGEVCFGYALSETKSWYSDGAGVISISYPWKGLGGGYHSDYSGGIFTQYYGGGETGYGFRLVLI